MSLSRRSFFGLFGCGVIGLATDWSGALKGLVDLPAATAAPTLTGAGRAYDFFFTSADDRPVMRYRLIRPTHPTAVLLQVSVAKGGSFRWCAVPGGEIVFREGHALDLVAADADVWTPVQDWQMTWSARGLSSVTGCEYCGTAYFAWPSGGHCSRCGGALPAPLENPSGRFATIVRDGQRTIVSLEPLRQTPDLSCVYCGVQLTNGRCVEGCGGV